MSAANRIAIRAGLLSGRSADQLSPESYAEWDA